MTRWWSAVLLITASVLTPIQVAEAFEAGDRTRIGAAIDDDHADLTGVFTKSRASQEVVILRSQRIVRMYVPACRGNLPQARRNLGALCAQASGLCASTPDPVDLGYWVYTAPAGPPAPGPEDWTSTGEVVCLDRRPPNAVEPVVTAADFRRLPLPASGLRVQPPNRLTLINVPTNLYADSGPVILPTRILGVAVRVRATPLRFSWTYGDGTSLSTGEAGGPYPRLDTAHTYRLPGARTVRLSTSYGGEYSVTGGPWLPIDGTAAVASPTILLTVRAAQNHLVSQPLG